MSRTEFDRIRTEGGYDEPYVVDFGERGNPEMHAHPFDAVLLMTSGEFTLKFESNEQQMRAGDLCMVEAGNAARRGVQRRRSNRHRRRSPRLKTDPALPALRAVTSCGSCRVDRSVDSAASIPQSSLDPEPVGVLDFSKRVALDPGLVAVVLWHAIARTHVFDGAGRVGNS